MDRFYCSPNLFFTLAGKGIGVLYFLDSNARVLLVSSELLAGVVFDGAFY